MLPKSFFVRMLDREGLISNDTYDPGGMTFMGISRTHHPYWVGWDDVDRLVEEGRLNEIMGLLRDKVLFFYEQNYWCPIMGDDILGISERIAEKVFDCAVNCGIGSSVMWLQEALNALNLNGKVYADLVVDGIVGPATLHALARLMQDESLHGRQEDMILAIIRAKQVNRYLKFVAGNGGKREKFRGLFWRAASV